MIYISIFFSVLMTLVVFRCLSEKFDFSSFIQLFFLVSFASNIPIFLVMSWLHVLSSRWIFLGIQALVYGIVIFVLWKIHKFSFVSLSTFFTNHQPRPKGIDWLIIVLICLIVGGFFVVGITTPPNNSDSLDHTHLTRIYYWIEQDSMSDTQGLNLFHLSRPLFSHIQLLWLFLLGGSENSFFLMQWFSLIVILFSINKISRSLQFSSTQGLICNGPQKLDTYQREK